MEESLARMRLVPRTKTMRRALGLTQEAFAARYRIPLGMLRHWEQGRAEPDQTARSLSGSNCPRSGNGVVGAEAGPQA
jgi:putative transcriptional regulator